MAELAFHASVTHEPDGSLWASVDELPGCFASGFSEDELQEALVDAIVLWLPVGVHIKSATFKEEVGSDAEQRLLVCA